MADFIESNSLIATDAVGLTTASPPPVRGSAEWLAALSEQVTDELSDSLAKQKTAQTVGGSALLELDAVIGKMRSHTRSAGEAGSVGRGSVSAFKPSALAAYGLKSMAVEVSLLSEPVQSSEPAQFPVPKRADGTVSAVASVRSSWPVNWSVLRVSAFRMPRLKARGGGNPSPSV